MHIELDCSRCFCHFTTSDGPSSLDEIQGFGPMAEGEPWSSMGDGSTFEDMIYTTLTQRGGICCPACGDPVAVSEESLGQLAMEMLAAL